MISTEEAPENNLSPAGEKRSLKTTLGKILTILVPVAFFVYLFFTNMNITLNDPDVWWHLKTGDYILENWDVPDVDPFAYTTPRPLSTDQKIGIKSQWLGQVVLSLAHRIGGLAGVGSLRNLLIILPMIILYIWLIRKGIGTWPAFILIIFPASILSFQLFYAFERPQGLSFSIVLLLIILLERLKRNSLERKRDISYVLMPITMALWSNMHAGFIVGNVIIMIYLASGVLSTGYHRLRRTDGAVVGPAFYAVCLFSIVASFANPNTYQLFFSYFTGLASMFVRDLASSVTGKGGSWVTEVVLEFKPLVYFYKHLEYTWLLFYWVFTGFLYLCLIVKYWLRRSFDFAEFATVTLVVFFANYYARGLMFSLTVMPLYLGKTVMELRPPATRYRVPNMAIVAAMLAIGISFCTYTYSKTPFIFKVGITDKWVTPWYPTELTKFLKKNPIDPPMYNYYTWGGYLIWDLFPKYQVFIDGRAIENMVNRTADSILKVQPGWQEELEAYNINFIAVPVIFRESGHIIPLAAVMAYDNNWKLVFVKNNSVLFVKDVKRNWEIIRKYSLDKEYVFLEILKVTNLLLASSPDNPIYNLSKADAFYALNNKELAQEIYNRYPSAVKERHSFLRYLQVLRPMTKDKFGRTVPMKDSRPPIYNPH
jgi:hypothetical protein